MKLRCGSGSRSASFRCGSVDGSDFSMRSNSNVSTDDQNYRSYTIYNNIKEKITGAKTEIINDTIIIRTTSANNWIVFTESGGIVASNDLSDKRLKKNIKNSNIDALDTIKKIKHRKFDWKNKEKHVENGYIAQELEELGDYTEKVIDPTRKRSIYS